MFLSSEGKRHDAAMLADSDLLTALEQYAVSPTGQAMCIYGDPAYPLRVNLMAPFRGAALTAQMEAFNKSMSNVRMSVEWLFGDVVEYFKFMDFKKNLKIGLSSIGKLYVVCALLRNALTCLYGNSTSSYFMLDPPTLEEYFAWAKFHDGKFRSLHLALSHDLYHYSNNIEVIVFSCLSDKKGERLIKRQISVKCNFIKSNKLSTTEVLQNQAESIFCKTNPTYNKGLSSKKLQQLMLKASDLAANRYHES